MREANAGEIGIPEGEQRWKSKGELPVEPRCQVWSVVGPVELLRQQEGKTRRLALGRKSKEGRSGISYGAGIREAAVMSCLDQKV